MDEIDFAQKENERHTIRSLKKINTNNEINATGFCLNCYENMSHIMQRWCNAQCRDDWQKRINFRLGR